MPTLKPPEDSKSPPSPAQSSKSTTSTRRKASNTKPIPSSRLSHLFSPPSAPLPPTISSSHSASVSPTPTPISQYGSSSSEEALARQLDRDAGGERIGLRSRRSSSATIRTLRNMGRQGSESVVTEEPEPIVPEAGPSRLPITMVDVPEPEETVVMVTSTKGKGKERDIPPHPKVNPKKSMTWQRWNNSPSFPKANVASPTTYEPPAQPPPPVFDTAPSALLQEPEIEPPDRTEVEEQIAGTEEVERPPQVPLTVIPEPSSPLKKGWWFQSRKARVGSKTTDGIPTKSEPIIVDMEGLNATTVEPIPPPEPEARAPVVREEPTKGAEHAPVPTGISPPAAEPAEMVEDSSTSQSKSQETNTAQGKEPNEVGDDHDPHQSESTATRSQTTSSRWYNYLGFPSIPTYVSLPASVPPVTPSSGQATIETTVLQEPDPPAVAENTPPQHLQTSQEYQQQESTLPASASVQETMSIERDTAAEEHNSSDIVQGKTQDTDHVGTPRQGTKWGGYIYSLVIPQIGEPSSSRASSITSRQHAESRSHEVKVDPAVEQKPVHEPIVPVQEPELSPSISSQTPSSDDRQEQLPAESLVPLHAPAPAPASWLTYLTSRAAQKTISNGASVTSSRKARTGSNVTEEVMDMSNDADFPPASQSGQIMPPPPVKADQRKKRLSIASKSSSQAPSRPSLEGPPALSSAAVPPAGPVVPPNFVVPSFEDTFNRPPRSLAPVLQETQPALQPPGGLTAGAAGLAWKAWGTATSYVYGGANGTQFIPISESSETRGQKEGRGIGPDLPRPLRESPGEESWRNVKRVVVFGVHGWFPAKMLNSLIGEPTGTSTKFATMMGTAVKSFLAKRGVTDIRLTIIPLEGEGTIESRVDRLYKAYLSSPSYINDTRRADAIFFAAHSQGCIVTTHLISRLIAQGHIRTANNADAVARCEWAFGPVGIMPPDPRKARLGGLFNVEEEGTGRQKVAMLAMCGVHLGPFYSLNSSNVIQPYLQWFENNAARELFEFQDTLSPVSQAYHKALAMILDNEVKVLLLSSLNDQVVPIYSSSFSTASHPLLLRALYVDGASYTTSDFMTKLITFALMLRNAGIDDEGLVGHLSEATAGGLTGVGHSTPYESPACYELAVAYLFRSGSAGQPLPPLEVESFTARDAKNDFELPWILRALTDAPAVKDLFPDELRELKENVVSWRPVTKALKDIKKRLEPMAGKQSRLRSLNHSASSTSLVSSGGKDSSGTSPSGHKQPLGLRRDW